MSSLQFLTEVLLGLQDPSEIPIVLSSPGGREATRSGSGLAFPSHPKSTLLVVNSGVTVEADNPPPTQFPFPLA